jgi:hypothetical protein
LRHCNIQESPQERSLDDGDEDRPYSCHC